MKKVKITILKTMLNEDLAKEYGICGLKACPTMQSRKDFVMKHGRPSISMFLHWLMVQTKDFSTMEIGLKSQG